MSGFHIEERAGIRVVVFHSGGCRPASRVEAELFDALAALREENKILRICNQELEEENTWLLPSLTQKTLKLEAAEGKLDKVRDLVDDLTLMGRKSVEAHQIYLKLQQILRGEP